MYNRPRGRERKQRKLIVAVSLQMLKSRGNGNVWQFSECNKNQKCVSCSLLQLTVGVCVCVFFKLSVLPIFLLKNFKKKRICLKKFIEINIYYRNLTRLFNHLQCKELPIIVIMALFTCCFEPVEFPEFLDTFVQKCTDPSCK